MKALIDRLVREWAYKVNNGMPDPANRNHLEVLADVFRSMKYSEQFISEYIIMNQNIIVFGARRTGTSLLIEMLGKTKSNNLGDFC